VTDRQTDGQTDRQTDRQTDGQTELIFQISRVSVLTRNKKNIGGVQCRRCIKIAILDEHLAHHC